MALKEKLGEEEVSCDVCVRDDPGVVLCLDCGVLLCKHCHESHKYSKEYHGHHIMHLKDARSEIKNINIKIKAKPLLCQEQCMDLNFYCETCEQLVCHYCTTTDHRIEDGHKHNTVEKIARKYKADFDKMMEAVEKMANMLNEAQKNIVTTREKFWSLAANVEQQIDTYYDQLQRKLQQQRENLKREFCEMSAQNKIAFSLQLEKTEHLQARLESVKDLNNVVKGSSSQEILSMKKQVTEDVEKLTGSYNKLNAEPVELVDMQFVPTKKYESFFLQFAHLPKDKAQLLSTKAEVPKWVNSEQLSIFDVVTRDHNDNPAKPGSTVTVLAEPGTYVVTAAVKDNQDGSYTVCFVASNSQEVNLSVTIDGHHITGSPFSVQVRQYSALDKPSKIVNDNGTMGRPWGIAFSRDGRWAVGDDLNNCVYVFDNQDNLVNKFGSIGRDHGQFNRSLAVAFDASNNLHVVDCNYHRIQKFDFDGSYLLQFGKY
ncbi:E3 ubiquitin-protein ligase TRIM71-like [Dysidea avara]|uniref:E3 ubiquitin-protein ligase TRIM71-like n=1 Tax=Dysidea avara TaxID=196820 RepID=UPI003329C9A3